MDLNTACFILFAFLFLGYLLLEGIDYGVGMLLPFLGKSAAEKQAIIQTIAPIWEGNEVWLITAGAMLFAAFPHVYATLFSGLYLALLFLLITLIFRGMAFALRNQDNNRHWQQFWDWAIFSGSLVPAFLWGIAITNLLSGLPIDSEKQYIGTYGALLNIYTLTGGLLFSLLFLVQGTVFLMLRLDRRLGAKLEKLGLLAGKYTLFLSIGFGALSFLYTDSLKLIPSTSLLILFLALFLCCRQIKHRQPAQSLIFSSISILSAISFVFLNLFPRFIASSLNPAWSLTIYNASSNTLTLKLMTFTAAIFLPMLLAFEIWKYYVFKDRIHVNDVSMDAKRILWTQLHRQLLKLIACSRDVVAALEKKQQALPYIKSKPAPEALASQLQDFKEKINYGHQVARVMALVKDLLK